jgi:hypothetical protein
MTHIFWPKPTALSATTFAALVAHGLASAQTPVDSIVDDANSYETVLSCNDDELLIQVSKENPTSQRAVLRNETIAEYLDVLSFDRQRSSYVNDTFVSTGLGEVARTSAEWKGFSSSLNKFRFPAGSSDFVTTKVHVFKEAAGVQVKVDKQGFISCGRFNFTLVLVLA